MSHVGRAGRAWEKGCEASDDEDIRQQKRPLKQIEDILVCEVYQL